MNRSFPTLSMLWMLGACAALPRPTSLPPVKVMARGETEAVATANADAADDPAIWRNAPAPGASLIVGTDKKGGLYIYDLAGRTRDFEPGAVNNVDLRDGVAIRGAAGILVAASDRSDLARARISLYRLAPETTKLEPLGKVEAGAGEAYGLCLFRTSDGPRAMVVLKDGAVRWYALDLSGEAPRARLEGEMKLATQAEGCAVDERTGLAYVAEEDAGLWRFSVAPGVDPSLRLIAPADGIHLVADAEGVALAPEGAVGGHVIVSSQGDNSYSVYALPSGEFVGRFAIAAGAHGSVEETDGIELALGDFGPLYPEGLFVAQDGINRGAAQNFKMVSWRDVREALARKP